MYAKNNEIFMNKKYNLFMSINSQKKYFENNY